MADILNFNADNCKNCYKCLRDCPVKAIAVRDNKARIEDELCILCGHCANVCRYNAKEVVSDIAKVKKLIASKSPVIASVAPAFAASFDALDFTVIQSALLEVGFTAAEETAVGAERVTNAYKQLLDKHEHKNLIASACPSVVRLMQIYYPKSRKYLAMVDSPMVAHAKMIKERNPAAKVVFIGPCIAKKREAAESGKVDAVLTFEELIELIPDIKERLSAAKANGGEAKLNGGGEAKQSKAAIKSVPDFFSCVGNVNAVNRARYYPINRGIIKSFTEFTDGYEYISVDGVARAKEVLENIDELTGMFIEMHACEFSCINGPCALNKEHGGFIKATEMIRTYTKRGAALLKAASCNNANNANPVIPDPNISCNYKQLHDVRLIPPDYEIQRILEATGKFKPEDELNCGACGYATCRDKAAAVYNGRAHIDMCVPFMREKAEGMSYDIIQNSPNGILAVDGDFNISEINLKASEILNIPQASKGEALDKFMNPTDFYLAMLENKKFDRKRVYIEKTDKWVETSIRKVNNQNMVFCIMTDITADIETNDKLNKLKSDTVKAADDVIQKQMRVVQEIASLLGETAAETKIALVKLKNTIKPEEKI